jgi:hypothetical protein
LGAIFVNKMEDQPIFFFGPGSLGQIGIQNLLPPVETLNIRPPRKVLCDLLPALASVLLNC